MSSFSSSPASSVSAAAPPPHVVEDCLGVVQLLSDGTVTRPTRSFLSDPPAHEIRRDLPVEWKDVVYDDSHGLRLRVYRPTTAATKDGEKKNLPVVVYFHGGGFCIGSFEHPSFHEVGLRIAHDLPAVVLSADNRLAPEHRLPAAQHDGETVLSWLSGHAASGADSWLAESADFERVFVWGDSCGGNMAHHVAVRNGSGCGLDIGPVRIAGYVLLCPYFGGEERMASEASFPRDELMGLALFDQMWRLALPVGATRDHPASNPFGPDSAPLDGVTFPPVLVADAEKDLLRDRTADYVARLRAMGKPVELVVFEGQGHGFFVYEPWGAAADELVRVVRRFVHGDPPATS
ncbi:probable carboxylesterase 15 [Lolium rigidum]|uniref:probable carboxylesterase 15 n=1 Tax=Lolium rigidum TaxID=89674 RepID=UPI001F5DDBDD|nr:probable carboxylesterase 15 [Lolium rigidum]